MSSVSPARLVASNVLLEVERNAASDSSELLDREIRKRNLTPQDARLATALAMTTLRHRLFLDYQYRPFLTQAPSRLSLELRTMFRMAAAQKFLFERIPDHAIAHETVELGRRQLRIHDRDARFANAVLRKLLAVEKPRAVEGNAIEKLSIQHSHPLWILRILEDKYGTRAAEVAAKNNSEPRLTLRVNRLRCDVETATQLLMADGIAVQPGQLVPQALVVQHASAPEVAATRAFQQGFLYFQDEASQLVAHLVNPKAGARILDLCSAPGGKATHMADLAEGKAEIIATDISSERLKLVQANVDRLQTPGVGVLPFAEAGELGEFDAVLVDAPCSGIGTVRRNPEIRYRCSDESIAALAQEQLKILQQAAERVKPGGRLIYSTCTVTDSENREVVARFLDAYPAFALHETDSELPAVQSLRDTDGLYRTWPSHLEMDGFEAAVLLRQGD